MDDGEQLAMLIVVVALNLILFFATSANPCVLCVFLCLLKTQRSRRFAKVARVLIGYGYSLEISFPWHFPIAQRCRRRYRR
jgi:hypothetical protein